MALVVRAWPDLSRLKLHRHIDLQTIDVAANTVLRGFDQGIEGIDNIVATRRHRRIRGGIGNDGGGNKVCDLELDIFCQMIGSPHDLAPARRAAVAEVRIGQVCQCRIGFQEFIEVGKLPGMGIGGRWRRGPSLQCRHFH
jgi:hypothetical protein